MPLSAYTAMAMLVVDRLLIKRGDCNAWKNDVMSSETQVKIVASYE